MNWMKQLDEPTEDELIQTVIPKPEDHSGSTFATPISNIRVTGTPEFITAVAKLLKPFLTWESSATRLAINLQQIEDRETGELTDNYALYLSAAMRSTQGTIQNKMLGQHEDADERLVNALEQAEQVIE
jgi:hypothetical protein